MVKKEEIEKQYEIFARVHKNITSPIRAREINAWVAQHLNFKLNMCVADFALPECAKKRCNTKELFVRVVKGWYFVK